MVLAGTASLLLSGCYTVNSFIDAPDANPGDGVCARAPGPGEAAGRPIDPPMAREQAARLREHVSTLSPAALARIARGDLSPPDASPKWAPLRADALQALRESAGAAGASRPGGLTASPQGLCTLRAAVMEANAQPWKSFIEVPVGTYGLTLPFAPGGAGGSLLVTQSMRIQGGGAGTTTVDGGDFASVFLINAPGRDVEVNHLTLRNGNSQAGGGARIQAGTIEMEDVVVRDNFAFTGGGGLAIDGPANVTLRRVSMTDNLAQGALGGAVWNAGTLRIHDSTLSGNQSNRAGAIQNNAGAVLNLRNVTVSGNRADVDDPAGASGTGGIVQGGFAFLNNVTITGNEGTFDRAGGLETIAGATTVLKNSIVAGNDGEGGADDCRGALSGDSKFNLIGSSAGCTITSHLATYRLDADADLLPLSLNGGPTATHNTSAVSLARDAGYAFPPPAADACEPFDQRGVPRPQGSGVCDMGALEGAAASVSVTGFVLVDAGTDTDIRELRNDDWLILPQLPAQLSIRAVTSGVVGSVVFDFAGDPAYRTENAAPYSLGGDTAGNYAPAGIGAGPMRLRATPHAGANGTGSAGISREIRFNVLGGS